LLSCFSTSRIYLVLHWPSVYIPNKVYRLKSMEGNSQAESKTVVKEESLSIENCVSEETGKQRMVTDSAIIPLLTSSPQHLGDLEQDASTKPTISRDNFNITFTVINLSFLSGGEELDYCYVTLSYCCLVMFVFLPRGLSRGTQDPTVQLLDCYIVTLSYCCLVMFVFLPRGLARGTQDPTVQLLYCYIVTLLYCCIVRFVFLPRGLARGIQGPTV